MTIEELKQPYEPEGVYAGMTQAEALRYLAKRYLRKPECVALCNEVANNLPALLKVAEAAAFPAFPFLPLREESGDAFAAPAAAP